MGKAIQRWADEACDLVPTNREDGYAQFTSGPNRGRYYHVVAWEEANGPVPDGLQLDHLCRRRNCRTVSHLDPVTPRVNTLRGDGPTAVNARKKVCPRCGGEWSTTAKGGRVCKPCKQIHQNERRRANGGRKGMNRVG